MYSWSSHEGYEKERPSEAELTLRSLKHMDQEGCLLKLKFVGKGVRKMVELRAASESEAGNWFEAIEASLRSMSMQIKYSLATTDIFQPTVLQDFQRFVDHCFIPKCTRDRRDGMVPKGLRVMKVVRVQNSTLLHAYHAKKNQIAHILKDQDRHESHEVLNPDVRTSLLDKPPADFPQLDNSVFERWVFHGTTPQGLEGIANSSFDLNRAGAHRGLLYGDGFYCAECCSKADEYSLEDQNGMRGILLCRASLGKILSTVEAKPDVQALQQLKTDCNYHTILGDRWRAAGTYREFIFNDKSQVYPEFIIYYRRMH